ncbi:hypothetical protein OEZ86_003905 [Tetradesmus obliquus]|nr:hypothetical protein OEZ86_003905 [Tetradesmus obliquus]
MQRLGGALQDVLSSQLSSDFVEGLKPVMLKGSLQISTHIQLAGEAAPVFIGLFPTLQAAVDAQKQSQALVGKLPAPIARKLIEAQLAHAQAVADAAAATAAAPTAAAAAGPGSEAVPGRLLSTTSDTTGVAAPSAAAAAAAAAAAGGCDLKRKRSDPRLNCIKSVQYRVSRFPQELHAMCAEHWERTRCARVVCNGVAGVMSVQGGRCVVSFSQHGQEVLKGVADFLRYAGEERIKKWRRHVRMVDFPRPNNRTGELMTAEEFLCIVGYQSEQGGGKRPKYMGGGAGGAAAAAEGGGSD